MDEGIKQHNPLDDHVIVVGLGSIGILESLLLATSGIKTITLIDPARVESKTNEELMLALLPHQVGAYKVEAVRRMILSIRPDCKLNIRTTSAPVYSCEQPQWIVTCGIKSPSERVACSDWASGLGANYAEISYKGCYFAITNNSGEETQYFVPAWSYSPVLVAAGMIAGTIPDIYVDTYKDVHESPRASCP
jgi:hypothetical protein